MEGLQFYGTGRRKESVARVWLRPGEGKIDINRDPFEKYFSRPILQSIVQEPLKLTNTIGRYDVLVNVTGGGVTGQAEAIRHGIARALVNSDSSLREVLKKGGLLTRDARVKERKKYGQKGARARFQFSKR
jgi:small subunit ribosomal protein S9